jgi:hypothetical protein
MCLSVPKQFERTEAHKRIGCLFRLRITNIDGRRMPVSRQIFLGQLGVLSSGGSGSFLIEFMRF